MSKFRIHAALLPLGIAALALAGCSGGSNTDVVPENSASSEPVGNIDALPPLNESTPTPQPTVNTAATAAPAVSPPTGGTFGTPDAQTYDDADATGLTSKVPPAEPTPEETQPAEQK